MIIRLLFPMNLFITRNTTNVGTIQQLNFFQLCFINSPTKRHTFLHILAILPGGRLTGVFWHTDLPRERAKPSLDQTINKSINSKETVKPKLK